MLAALGIAIGLPGGYGLGKLVESQLFGLNARDPLTFLRRDAGPRHDRLRRGPGPGPARRARRPDDGAAVRVAGADPSAHAFRLAGGSGRRFLRLRSVESPQSPQSRLVRSLRWSLRRRLPRGVTPWGESVRKEDDHEGQGHAEHAQGGRGDAEGAAGGDVHGRSRGAPMGSSSGAVASRGTRSRTGSRPSGACARTPPARAERAWHRRCFSSRQERRWFMVAVTRILLPDGLL